MFNKNQKMVKNIDLLESLSKNPILTDKFSIVSFDNCFDALNYITAEKEKISAIVCDYDFSGHKDESKRLDGLTFLKYLNTNFSEIPVIMISGVAENRGKVAIDSILNFAYAFLDKPFSITKLLEILENAINSKSKTDIATETIFTNLQQYGLITQNKLLAKQILESIKIFNNSDLGIIIFGETGTGKTRIAHTIHKMSKFNNKTIGEIHCGWLSNDVNTFRSELFGHVKDAYTGAYSDKKGYLELCEIIVLDDIQHIPPEVQKGLLQALQEKFFYKFGDTKNRIKFNSKIIATSTLNEDELTSKYMHKEFYYRLKGDFIVVPPLRERKEDIPLLIKHFTKKFFEQNPLFCSNYGIKEEEIFEQTVIDFLINWDWPGNIRQLENFVTKLLIFALCNKNKISLSDLKFQLEKERMISKKARELFNSTLDTINIKRKKQKLTKEALISALIKSNCNINKATKILGFNNNYAVYYYIKKFEINLNEIQRKIEQEKTEGTQQ